MTTKLRCSKTLEYCGTNLHGMPFFTSWATRRRHDDDDKGQISIPISLSYRPWLINWHWQLGALLPPQLHSIHWIGFVLLTLHFTFVISLISSSGEITSKFINWAFQLEHTLPHSSSTTAAYTLSSQWRNGQVLNKNTGSSTRNWTHKEHTQAHTTVAPRYNK